MYNYTPYNGINLIQTRILAAPYQISHPFVIVLNRVMLVIHLRWLMLGHTLPHCLSSVDWVNGPRWVALPHKRLLAEHCLFSAVGGANDICGWVKAARFSCIVVPSEGGCVCGSDPSSSEKPWLANQLNRDAFQTLISQELLDVAGPKFNHI